MDHETEDWNAEYETDRNPFLFDPDDSQAAAEELERDKREQQRREAESSQRASADLNNLGVLVGYFRLARDIADEDVPLAASIAGGNLPVVKDTFDRALDRLPGREQEVIRRRYGLDGRVSLTLEAIGEAHNVPAERVRQVGMKAIRKLRHPSRGLRGGFASQET